MILEKFNTEIRSIVLHKSFRLESSFKPIGYELNDDSDEFVSFSNLNFEHSQSALGSKHLEIFKSSMFCFAYYFNNKEFLGIL